MPETDNALEASAAARQHLHTAMLLGVAFTPVRIAAGSAEDLPGDQPPDVAITLDQSQTSDEKRRLLDDLRDRHARECPHCTVVTSHTRLVFGEGDAAARLMFIGEAPGEEEDRTGRPFVGRAGQKLDEIIKAMGLQREQVYIANILKSRPPENRTPLLPEVEKCAPYLREQIRIIAPAVIVALGGPAAKMLLQTETGITRLRGQWGTYVDGEFRVAVMPTFHPAYLLRNYTPDTRKKMWSDMQAVMQSLAREKSRSS